MFKYINLTAIAVTSILFPLSVSAQAVDPAPQQAIAASLSASFGNNTDAGAVIELLSLPTSATIQAPTSVSVAGAVGDFAVASAVANINASAATSGATTGTDSAPMVDVSLNGRFYETAISFVPTNFDEIAMTAAADAVADLCSNGFAVTENLTASTPVGFLTFPGAVNGTIEVTCN